MTNLVAERFSLAPHEPPPFEVMNRQGKSQVVLVCEHAGRRIPACLGDLGVEAAEMDRHIAYDIGAEMLSRELSELLDAPLIIQPYSRLVIDCNRPLEAQDCVPEISDGTVIPANQGLSEDDRKARYDAIHRPFHDAVKELCASRGDVCLVPVHSFTPRMRGVDRPWQLGLLHGRHAETSQRLMDAITLRHPELVTEYNEPYTIDDMGDYTVPVHGEAADRRYVLLEVRNNEISDQEGSARWASIIGDALQEITS